MTVQHKGVLVPVFPERWDPADEAYIWVCWEDILEGASILTSVWTMPSNWTQSDPLEDQTVSDEGGVDRLNCNGVFATTSETSGIYQITNTVTLSGSPTRTYKRSVSVEVLVQ
jgi:hypothetical protein